MSESPRPRTLYDWGSVNKPFEPAKFDALWDRVKAHVLSADHFIQHLHVGEHSEHYLPVKVTTSTAWQSLFARNMFIRPAAYNAQHKPEWKILNVPDFVCDPERDGTHSDAVVIVNFGQRKVLIAGMRYAVK